MFQAFLKGIPVFVAAGNEGKDAAKTSPASEPTAITIAASDSDNKLSSFTNYGKKVDLIAPGAKIKCASIVGDSLFDYLSGTSMSTPLAAGVGSVILSANSEITTPQKLDAELKNVS